VNVQFLIDVANVAVKRARADAQVGGDFFVTEALGQLIQHTVSMMN